MAYKVLTDFKDKETEHVYKAGDKYPDKGRALKARVAELTKTDGPNDSFKGPVIEETK